MRLVLFEGPGAGRGIRPGVLTAAGVVDVSSATAALVAHSPQHLMEQIIDSFEALRPAFERLAASALAVPLDVVRLRPPLPRVTRPQRRALLPTKRSRSAASAPEAAVGG